ncbi:MAG: tRNA 2-selenouridine(34) synthase MnmH [Bacteroidales bacterium]|jgi:tRNA 2-selenouridine synthase|nr:tRNA 2-selenouridine(34) synthase MnmH [Bacteroidales bacterium]
MASHQTNKTDIISFMELAANTPVVDVRSPSEFRAGHIPGAHNIPLFNDAERAEVGTRYKKEGSLNAILEGIRLSGPVMHLKLEEALRVAGEEKRLLVHCWRGGMRSEAMAWLFSLGGIETHILEGGYKAYRRHVLETLSAKRDMIILGGLTGSGKTHILKYIEEKGNQVIDLEHLANHKGSAFGSLGQPAQPSSEHFSNMLFGKLSLTDPEKPVWLEDESRNIGMVFMPEEFYLNIQSSPAVILMMDINTRLPRLMEEYSCYPPELLLRSVMKISKRLGGDRTREAVDAVNNGDFATAIAITLQYYDKAYRYSLNRKPQELLHYVNTDTDDVEINAGRILEAAGRLKKSL